ncbi:NTP transferase domain-containing protein [Novosphingobium jiangmenense]|uniref:Nucleotidyltransferase family protein n=1 Tax=Novosphingobium jiangmenense TaxID=2791981 RepID=A0ABS0HGW2_9SPHN|nr:nucleotidyltransferase family protein [Novosphingobium jiangmenense]
MKAGDIAVILLAAGRASRFGGGKLAADLAGKPVALHVGERLAAMPFARKVLVCSTATPPIDGFERIELDPSGAPLSRSIATAITAVSGTGAALIALADMPLVPTDHFERLIEAFDGERIGTVVAGRTMVPAIFGAHLFSDLAALDGDRGAAALLRDAPAITLEETLALDIDTPDDLARAEALLQGR